jgi:superoxide reductase
MSDTYPAIDDVHVVDNPEVADAFEAKHTPHIEIAVIEGVSHVTVQTSYYAPHPNEIGHFFDWIELYVAGQPVVRFAGTAEVAQPYVSVNLNLAPDTKITALAHCNLHGTWKAEALVEAEGNYSVDGI